MDGRCPVCKYTWFAQCPCCDERFCPDCNMLESEAEDMEDMEDDEEE